MTFSTTIRQLRRDLDLTQAELAARLGVDKQSVSNWETGRNAPWPAHQEGILRQLGVAPPLSPDPAPRRPSISERILKP